MSAFCFFVLAPTIGFDDANITMSYAENIAAGHGYVYNIGGERVEGSTSPLWTVINTLGFLLPISPEVFLAGLGLLIAIAIIWVSTQIGDIFFRTAGVEGFPVAIVITVGFLSLPSLFGWVVWSLMDFGLWLLLITTAFWLTMRLLSGEEGRRISLALATVAALMSVTRPEGISAALGFAVLLGIIGPASESRRRHTGTIALVAVLTGLTFALVAWLRFTYFGDIFPNTFYSKVSTDGTARLKQGVGYAFNFLKSPFNLTVIILAVLAPVLVWRDSFNWRALLPLWVATMLCCAGGSALYVILGGDHFGSFRFFLFLFPLLFPLAALTLALVWRRMTAMGLRHPALPRTAALALIAVTWGVFSVEKGDYVREFRIAEEGREIGRRLNDYPGRPSVGIIAAGGVAMTYDGHLYDLLGLNWVEMARADRQKVASYINHGGFSREVFYANLPDIVLPRFTACDQADYDNNPFFPRILDYIFAEPEFQALYTFECWGEMAFYRRKDFPSARNQARSDKPTRPEA